MRARLVVVDGRTRLSDGFSRWRLALTRVCFYSRKSAVEGNGGYGALRDPILTNNTTVTYKL